MDVNGRHLRLLARGGYCPVWAPDSSRIAFLVSATDEWRVSGVSDTSQWRIGPADDLAWAPDGKRVALASQVQRNGVTHTEIHLAAIGVPGSRPLAVLQSCCGGLAWSADGLSVLLATSKAITLVTTDKAARRRLTHAPGSYGQPSASLIDGRIVFVRYPHVWVMDANGAHQSRLVGRPDGAFDAEYWSPAWSQ